MDRYKKQERGNEMNTTLNLTTTSIPQSYPADRTNPFILPAITRLLRAIARFFASGDDPAAIYYIQSKYGGEWD
jgi:hypothetical protein